MKRILNIGIVFLLLVACKETTDSKENRFFEEDLPEKIALKGVKFSFEGILNPKGILLKDGYLIVSERKNILDEKLHVIDMENEKYLYPKGKDGIGPNEITLVISMNDVGEADMIWVYDSEQRKFSKFNISNSNSLSDDEFKAPNIEHFITHATLTSDSTLLAGLVDGWEKFIHLKKDGEILNTFGSWKDNIKLYKLPRGLKEEDLDPNLVSNLFQGSIRGNIDNGKFVLTGVIVDYIELIDLNSGESKIIRGPVGEMPDFEITYSAGYQMPQVSRTSKTHYTDAFVGEHSVFVLYKGVNTSLSDECRIFELDFEGNLLSHFGLDYPLHGFTVDESAKLIYGITADEEPNIVKFAYK